MYFAKHISCVSLSASFSNLLILCKNDILSSSLDIKNTKKENAVICILFFIYGGDGGS